MGSEGVRVCARAHVFGTFDMKILCNQSHAEWSVTAHSCCCDTETSLAHQRGILAPLTSDDDTIRCTLRHGDHGGCGESNGVRDLPGISMVPGRGAALGLPFHFINGCPAPGSQGRRHFQNVHPNFQNFPAPCPPQQRPLRKGQRSTCPGPSGL